MRTHQLEGRKREVCVSDLGKAAHCKQESLAGERAGELGNVARHKRRLTNRREEEGGAGSGLDVAMFTQYGTGSLWVSG